MDQRTVFDIDLAEIRNINEELVIEIMEQILQHDDSICRCQLCIEDIYALSLNKLKPLYVQSTFKDRTLKGYDLTKILDREKIEEAVRESINTVSDNPYH